MYSICQFSGLYSHFQVTSGQMTPLPVTSGHLRSHDVISCHVTASFVSYSLVGSEMCSTCQLSALYSHFQVTSCKITSLPGHFRSRDVIPCHVTASFFELQPCRK